MSIERWFTTSYAEARRTFLETATRAGAHITTYPHPQPGPNGERLAIDVARLGPRHARKVLLTTSGTHGVEGYCGSGNQIGLFETRLFDAAPADMAFLQVHAHNPHGFAHDRRVTEDNVDLNRNFVDFEQPLSSNVGYDELHHLIVPKAWSGPTRIVADMGIVAQVATRGRAFVQAALTRGQYNHPDGLFFGGRAPTWSHRTIRAIAGAEVARSHHLAVLDFHTGLGKRGVAELIVDGDESDSGYQKARSWYGDAVKSPAKGDSVSAVVEGTVAVPYGEAVGAGRCTFVTVEYGTRPMLDVLRALRADNWIHLHGNPRSRSGEQIRRDIRAAFYVEDLSWKEQVWTQANEIARATLSGLSAL